MEGLRGIAIAAAASNKASMPVPVARGQKKEVIDQKGKTVLNDFF
jgi:hypothetical protein